MSHLATPGAVARMRLADSALCTCHPDSSFTCDACLTDRPFRPVVSALDLVDSFYQFRVEGLSDCFCVAESFEAREFGITEAFDETGERVSVAPWQRAVSYTHLTLPTILRV